MSKLAKILDETIAYYGTHERGTRPSGSCAYRTSEPGEARYCAVGRCIDWDQLDPEFRERVAINGRPVVGFSEWLAAEVEPEGDQPPLDCILKPDYRGVPIGFWVKLQALHDASGYWDRLSDRQCGYRLSPTGERFAAKIRATIERWEAADGRTFDECFILES